MPSSMPYCYTFSHGQAYAMEQILVIDIGNSNIVIGMMGEGGVVRAERIDTIHEEPKAENLSRLRTVLEALDADRQGFTGGIVASVVPALTAVVCDNVAQLTGIEMLRMGDAKVVVDMPLLVDEPARLGHDRLADAVGGKMKYGYPLMVVDMGTATTVNVVDGEGQFAGGMIIPGMKTSFDALCSRAAQLRAVPLQAPDKLIGRNTTTSMQSGLLYGYAAMVDGLIARVSEEMNVRPMVILTGGLASLVEPLCREQVVYDEHLLLSGLYHIYCANQKG